MRESAILHRCMLRLTEIGCRVFRNNVAQAWVGSVVARITRPTTVTLQPGDVVIRNARPLHAGLAVGSGDLIGWTPDGRFLSVETKTKTGRITTEQLRFQEAVNAAGGLGIVARDEDSCVAAVLRFTNH